MAQFLSAGDGPYLHTETTDLAAQRVGGPESTVRPVSEGERRVEVVTEHVRLENARVTRRRR